MPVYEYKCDECENEREIILPFGEAGKRMECECGQVMRRKFSPVHFASKIYSKDKILGTLNTEAEHPIVGGSPVRSKRSQQALASGIDYARPLEDKIFSGFG